MPVDFPKPRGSHVNTEYPASRSDLMVSAPGATALGSASPASPHPGPMRITGAGWSAVAVGRANQWRRMRTPSNEVRSQSLVEPTTGVANTGAAAGREHAAG